MTQAYPLQWPQGYPRTTNPQRSRFDTPLGLAARQVYDEIARLGGRLPVISTNRRARRDGLPYSSDREPEDSGVAVYFVREGKQLVFACDKWATVAENLTAIARTISAMRGIDRWGVTDALERTFTGFEALPAPDDWRAALGLPAGHVTRTDVLAAYRERAKSAHPDAGGSTEAMAKLNAAKDAALKEVQPDTCIRYE